MLAKKREHLARRQLVVTPFGRLCIMYGGCKHKSNSNRVANVDYSASPTNFHNQATAIGCVVAYLFNPAPPPPNCFWSQMRGMAKIEPYLEECPI